MISIVESSRDTRRTLLYNEEKLEQKKAKFLGAFNFWQDDNELTLDNKLDRLRDLISLNERSQATTIHFSLNYHPAQELEDRKMLLLAREFLQQLDFGDQPALVYRHLDAGHPHSHIVTVNIRPDGSRIPNDKRSPHYLQRVCKELEQRHGLLPAGNHTAMNHWAEDRVSVRRLEYGKTPTKTGIESVLHHVLPNFNYTTLEELNAVLGLYRVQADRGSEHGLMYGSRGLYYRMIDERGVKVGAPVKASSLDNRPTLDYLDKRYLENRLTREQFIQHVRVRLSMALHLAGAGSLANWRQDLTRDGIEVVTPRIPIRRKHAPSIEAHPDSTPVHAFDGHGFFYVDFSRSAVFRDTELGEKFTAASILRQTDPDPRHKLRLLLELSHQHDEIIARRLSNQQELRHQRHLGISL